MRNVLGFRDADHEETAPGAPTLAVTALSCSLVGQSHEVRLRGGSRAHSLYGSDSSIEDYYCSYGVNPELVADLEASGLLVGATDAEGDVRMVERHDHPFFVGTLFLPQTRSTRDSPHPVLKAFESAVSRTRRT